MNDNYVWPDIEEVTVGEYLDDDDPMWQIDVTVQGLLEGYGASEDHEFVKTYFLEQGFHPKTVERIHKALVFGDFKEHPTSVRLKPITWNGGPGITWKTESVDSMIEFNGGAKKPYWVSKDGRVLQQCETLEEAQGWVAHQLSMFVASLIEHPLVTVYTQGHTPHINSCICTNDEGKPLNQCDECPR